MTPPTLRPLSVGEILDQSFKLYRTHFGALATIVLVCTAAPFLLGAYLTASGGLFGAPGGWILHVPLFLLYVVLFVVLSSIATAATVFVVSESYLGRSLRPGEALARAVPFIGRVVLCSLLFGLVAGVGFMLFFVPGVVLVCGLVLSTPVIVLEPETTASGALARSWRLTRGSKWRMFGVLVTIFVLIYLPGAALQGIAELVWPGSLSALALPVVGGIVHLFLYPLFHCVLTVAYYDLRVRREGFDLELLASSLQPA